MALTKSIQLPNSTSGDYIRLTAYRWDRSTQEASAQFHLYASAAAAQAAPSAPVCLIAVLRLSGAKFEAYLGAAGVDAPGKGAIAQLYRAAKAELLIAGGGLTEVKLGDARDA